jgi:SAM-dependent methyltransferase
MTADVTAGPYINVGSGPSSPEGWINFDGPLQARIAGHPWLARIGRRVLGVDVGHWPRSIRHLDIRSGLPFAEGAVAAVYASHVLEHLHRDETVAFLAHVRTVLKPRGVCRVVVPDLHAIVNWYLLNRAEPASQRTQSSSDLLMGMLLLRPREARPANRLAGLIRGRADLPQHKWMYDQEGLLAVFEDAGFTRPEPKRYLESAIAPASLEQVERADRICDGAGVCVEARKDP